jgi:hypothetical protein
MERENLSYLFALYYNFSSFDCAKSILFISLVMGRGRFDE